MVPRRRVAARHAQRASRALRIPNWTHRRGRSCVIQVRALLGSAEFDAVFVHDCHLLHDDRVRLFGRRIETAFVAAAGLAAWRLFCPDVHLGELQKRHRARRRGRRDPRHAMARRGHADPDPARLDVPGGLCLPAARVRRLDPRRARSAMSKGCFARSHLAPAVRRDAGFTHKVLSVRALRSRNPAAHEVFAVRRADVVRRYQLKAQLAICRRLAYFSR